MRRQRRKRFGGQIRLRAARWSGAFALVAVGLQPLSGCRVAESDATRWETTQRGPYKLVAVVTHDKYSWDLRAEAALSLVRMPPRGGVRQGISFLIDRYKDEEGEMREGALNQIPEEARRRIVDSIAPAMIKELDPPPPPHAEGRLTIDPSIPTKDAAFAMLIHEPPLVSSEKTRADLRAALTRWVQVGFEDRVENGAQQFGVEQLVRFLGSDSVKGLPSIIGENTARLDRIGTLVNDVGDDATKLETSKALVALAKRYASPAWLEAQAKIVREHNAKSSVQAEPAQVAAQVDKIQERRLVEEVFPTMKRVGGRPSVEYLFGYAADVKNSVERRALALAALEGRVDKSNAQDLEHLAALARNDDTPDPVRDAAFQRMGEFPKEQIVPALYKLFEPKKWKVRWVAGETLLKALSSRQIGEFMSHLPKTAASKMGMTESLTYGTAIRRMETAPGGPAPRDVILSYLPSHDLGPKLTALGFFWQGKREERALLQAYADDASPLPRCDKEDDCGWSCEVPKSGDANANANANATEAQELKTVGEFVKFCLLPSMGK